jgi:hypothetical protein
MRRPLVLAALALALVPAQAVAARSLIVTKRHVHYAHFTSIQKAVNAAHRGDWVLIDRGVYVGPVKVTKNDLHIVGLNRNRTIVDGRHRKNANGIEVFKANNVWIENLTVRNFDRPSLNGDNGNEIWWNGGDGSGRIGAHGWYGNYLTAYDTGTLGGYGIFTSNSVRGTLDHSYASGFADAALYIGACRDCRATVKHFVGERSALGYSGTNSGGHLVIENSVFRNNSIGVAPNSLNNDDQPPPQDGACNSGSNTSPTPTFSGTAIRRCTIFRNNVVENNNNLTAPQDAGAEGPWGVGVILPGTYADLVTHNTIRGNANYGLLGLEMPNPFPPTSSTIYFQFAGNRIDTNSFSGNATNAANAQRADIGLEGGAFGSQQSVNNCLAGNTFQTAIPASPEGTWGCQNATTPNPGPGLVGEILALLSESSSARHATGQKRPPRQKTMPHPCRGAPRNPLCH